MQEIAARAALVSAADVGEGLTTSIPRAEIEEALRSEAGPLELVLDVTRFAAGRPAETGNVMVMWEREDAERLLSQSAGEQLTLTFDRETLREAIDADVEAHGLREKALVLAVAVTAAAGTAGAAAAAPVLGEGTSGHVVMVGDGAGGQAAQPEGGSTGQAIQPEGGSTGQAVQPAGGSTGQAAQPEGGSTGQAVQPAGGSTGQSVQPEGASTGQAVQPAGGSTGHAIQPEGGSTGAAVQPAGGSAGASADSGFEISSPSPAEAVGIGGAVALAITGAAFVAGRRRTRPT